MTPFLAFSLKDLLLVIMSRFSKKEKTDTFKKLSTIDPADKKKSNYVDIGFADRGTLKKVTEKKAAGELCILSFKNDCIKFLSGIVIKLLERSSLKYSLV